MLRLACALLIALLICACTAAPAQEALSSTFAWTTPSTLSDCGGERPQVVFPSKEPTHASGPGAIVWSAASGCEGRAGARVAQLTAEDLPRVGEPAGGSYGKLPELRGPLLAAAAPHGEIAIAGAAASGREAAAIQGRAGGRFTPLAPASGFTAPFAATTAWLGDLALAAPAHDGSSAGALLLHVERFFAHTFVRNQPIDAAAGSVGALTVALDYRTDALVAWEHDGGLYERELPGKHPPQAIQRIASVGSHVGVAALASDDYRGILAWSEQRGGQTSVYLDQSAVGVRFGAPKLLESFRDPAGPAPPASAPLLIRLSNESVMLAWPGVVSGRWVVRTAAIDQHGVGPPSTIAAPAGDALLCDLAAGPDGEAFVLWSEPQQGEGGAPETRRQAIFAARGIDAAPRRTIFGAPEEVAPPGPNSEAAVAIDPASDRALVVWRSGGGALQYALRDAARAR
jgi:hypothetical protein